jgi:hypothetical protein
MPISRLSWLDKNQPRSFRVLFWRSAVVYHWRCACLAGLAIFPGPKRHERAPGCLRVPILRSGWHRLQPPFPNRTRLRINHLRGPATRKKGFPRQSRPKIALSSNPFKNRCMPACTPRAFWLCAHCQQCIPAPTCVTVADGSGNVTYNRSWQVQQTRFRWTDP